MNKKNEQPIVSVCMISYNHEKYIAQAIEGFLIQKTTFPIELVIGEDCSTDNTKAICEKYAVSHPGVIRLIPSEHNLGMMPNFIRTLKACNGKYIALCEGDDYWTDPLKLQKQVDFLEANADFSSIYTNSIVKEEPAGIEKIAKINIWDVATTAELLYHDDFIKDNTPLSPGHTSSFLFRNFLIKSYPDWLFKCRIGDFPMFMLISKYGKAKFLNEITGVHRLYSLGISSVNFSFLDMSYDRIFIYKNINKYFEGKYNKQISKLISKHYINIFKFYYKKNKIIKCLLAIVIAFYYNSRCALHAVIHFLNRLIEKSKCPT